jgi:hypothetical protein
MTLEYDSALRFLINEDLYLLSNEAGTVNNFLPEERDTTTERDSTDAPIVVLAEPEPIAAPLQFKYLGKNSGAFLILINYKGLEYMDQKHQDALNNTLQRKGLSFDDVAIVNLDGYPNADADELIAYFSPKKIMVMGAECLLPAWRNLKINKLEERAGCTALYTYSFTQMMGDKEKTKAFWEKMKLL